MFQKVPKVDPLKDIGDLVDCLETTVEILVG
jgi:hypothetical protein